MNYSTKLQPLFERLAQFVPATSEPTLATIPGGGRLWMPAGYRDTRTVVTGLFQQDETRLTRRLVRPGMTFVDVGAYVGYFTILTALLVGPEGNVYAFEPNGLAYQFLERNIRINNCANALAVDKAVTNSTNPAALVRDPVGPESFITRSPATDGVLVQAMPLDAFFEARGWPRVHVVKMNIEGAERDALIGMTALCRRNRNLKLMMEFNPKAMARSGVSRADLTAVLRSLGFQESRIIERGLAIAPNGELLPDSDAVYNLLLTGSEGAL